MSTFTERAQRLHCKVRGEVLATGRGVDLVTAWHRSRSVSPTDEFVMPDILDAYGRWCEKSEPVVDGRREGIMISCPNPAHPDHNPSAWLNREKDTYYCAACGEGGDAYTIAGYHFGFDPRSEFPALKRAIANDLGVQVSSAVEESSERQAIVSVDWRGAWERQSDEQEWLLEPVIPARAQVLLYAPRKTGKSLLALEWGAAVATGRALLGRPASDPADVLIIDYENTLTNDVVPRLEAFGYMPGDLDRLHFYSFPPIDPLDTAKGGRQLERLLIEHRPVLVVLDNFARITEGPENDSDTLRDYYRHTAVVLKQHGVASIRLDNTGKDKKAGARGSSAKDDDVDLIWKLVERPGGLRLHRDAQRRTGAPENVELDKIEVPHLHFTLVGGNAYPAGTKELAAILDGLEVPVGASTRKCRALLRDAGQSASNEILSAAVRYRLSGGTLHGTPSELDHGTRDGTITKMGTHQDGTPSGTLRNTRFGKDGTGGVSRDTPVPMRTEMAAPITAPADDQPTHTKKKDEP